MAAVLVSSMKKGFVTSVENLILESQCDRRFALRALRITGIFPHPHPLPAMERGRVRGKMAREIGHIDRRNDNDYFMFVVEHQYFCRRKI